jgi:hypothetical protein
MTWYAAHAVLLVVFRDGDQREFPIWENIYLVAGDTPQDARAAAERFARQVADAEDDSFTWDGRPARWEFKGIRKLIKCDVNGGRTDGSVLPSGTEATYLQMIFKSDAELAAYLSLHPTSVLIEE